MTTNSTAVLKGAESYSNFFNPKKCVVCIHGFGGNPAELRFLADRLEKAGYSVSVPRLPGHGTSLDDMLKTTRHDWTLAARMAYLEARQRCTKVYLVGLSMGGVLAALLAAEISPERIALISVPHTISNPAIYLTPILGRLLKVLPMESPTLGINDDEARRTHICYREGLPLLGTWELFQLIKTGMAALPHVTAPTLVMQSSGDTVIPASSAAYILDHLGSRHTEQVLYSRSNHVIPRDYDRDAAADAVIRFFGKRLSKS